MLCIDTYQNFLFVFLEEYKNFPLEKITYDSKSIYLDTKHMDLAGLCEAKLYMRTENVKLWEKLDSFNGMLSVQGPPGTGKSSLVWAWTYYQALQSSQKFVWLHYSSIGAANFVILHKKEGKVVRNLSEADYKFNNVLSSIGSGNCTVIVDGLTKQNYMSIMGQVTMWYDQSRKERKAVFVSSYSIQTKIQDHIADHIVYSWTYEQYEKACSYPFIFSEFKEKLFPVDSSINTSLQEILKFTTDPNQSLQEIKGISENSKKNFKKMMNEVMYERFYYAGGCARWFFGYNFEKTISDIKKRVDSIYRLDEYMKDLPGHKNTNTVNPVLACFEDDEDDVFVLVSRYIAHFFSRRCGVSVLKGL
ncbi:MAG: hypothetical protein HFP76_00145, partial [Methylococcales symbiont of Iophon sp. n. MRB-2018]